jgi:nicotinamide phosphoribosyltransferase
VSKDGDEYTYEDGLTWEEAQDNNELKTVFKNGKLLKVYTLDEVRQNLHGGDF